MGSFASRPTAPKSPPAPPPPREGAASIYRLSQIVPESQATFRISSAPPKPASSRHIEVSTNSPERSAPKPEATLVNVSPAPGHLSAIEAAFQTLPELEGTRCASPAAPNVAELQPTAQGAYGPFLIWCVEHKRGLYWKIDELPDNSCTLSATTDRQNASFMYLYPYEKGGDNETFRIAYHRYLEEYYQDNTTRREELNNGKYVVDLDEPAACFLCARNNTWWKNHLSMEYDSSNHHEFQIKLLSVPSINGKCISTKHLISGGTFFATAQSHSGQTGYVWIKRNTHNANADTLDTARTTYQSGCKTTLERYRGNQHTIEYMHFKLLPVKKARHASLRGASAIHYVQT